MDEFYNKHYIRLNENGQIIKGFSDAFEQPQEGDICINEKGGYQFRLFPNGEENPSLLNEYGVLLYEYNGDKVAERNVKEIEEEIESIEQQPKAPDPIQQLRADVDYIAIMTEVEL